MLQKVTLSAEQQDDYCEQHKNHDKNDECPQEECIHEGEPELESAFLEPRWKHHIQGEVDRNRRKEEPKQPRPAGVSSVSCYPQSDYNSHSEGQYPAGVRVCQSDGGVAIGALPLRRWAAHNAFAAPGADERFVAEKRFHL